ncbi:MAG: hypothetical protein IPH90_04760 [Thermomonas sp.]|nr:hypothetical protein [Thermomonas sp.]
MLPAIVKLASTILHNPLKVSVTPESLTVDIMKSKLTFVDKRNKSALLLEILKDKNIKTAGFTEQNTAQIKFIYVFIKRNITGSYTHN